MSFWVTRCHSETPISSPSWDLAPSMVLIVSMAWHPTPVPPLLVFDAPSLLYRAFYALPDSITDPSKQHPVNALLGSVNLVLYEWEAHRPRAVVACFGPDAAPYRTELYPPYHADRPPMPDGLVWPWERAYDFYERFGWTVARDETVEEVDEAEVLKRYGIEPEQVPDFIAPRGDPSDGLPGAKGIGPKTAAELLREHGSLEAILDGAIREQRPKLRA